MARVTETEELLQRLMAEVGIGGMVDLGRHMLQPYLAAIVVTLKHQATFLAPDVTA